MSTELIHLSNEELDTIGEVMNISMGSAATAISTMLDRPVNITTPQLRQDKLANVDCSELEPAIMVKIKYVEGVDGTNIILLRRRDMQIILNLLMGNDDISGTEDFEFDDMSMSAACEVMNQMMGASATALSEVLGFPINISTPESMLIDNITDAYKNFGGENSLETEVIAISFEMDISNILNTTFTSFWPLEMAKKIVDTVTRGVHTEGSDAAPSQPAQQQVPPTTMQPDMTAQAPAMGAQQPMQPQAMPQQQMPTMQPDMTAQTPAMGAQQPMQPQAMPQQQMPTMQPDMTAQTPAMGAQQPMQPQAMPQQQMPTMQPDMTAQAPSMGAQQMPQGYGYPAQNMMGMPNYGQAGWQMPYPPMYAPNGYPAYPQQQQAVNPNVNVQKADFPVFNPGMATKGFGDSNLNLLMNIPLEVSVVIGKTKRKIRDIMDLGQGSVVELDKQTGAPAEIIVNGQLLAYGDVVVVDDNFAVRVTEIVGAEELLQSLTGKI